VLLRQAMPIGAGDTTGDLHDRLSDTGAAMIVQALAQLPTLVAEAQPAEGVTYAAKIDKAEARVDWTLPAVQVDRLIRGLSPHPGAWADVGGERVRLLRARLADGSARPGQVLQGFTVACGTGAVEITELQRAGKRPMPTSEALRGWRLPEHLA
jgi:methionyl-tRNA formyltransferase